MVTFSEPHIEIQAKRGGDVDVWVPTNGTDSYGQTLYRVVTYTFLNPKDGHVSSMYDKEITAQVTMDGDGSTRWAVIPWNPGLPETSGSAANYDEAILAATKQLLSVAGYSWNGDVLIEG